MCFYYDGFYISTSLRKKILDLINEINFSGEEITEIEPPVRIKRYNKRRKK